jgi:hypothetical protein
LPEGPTKKELIKALRASGDDLIKKVSKLDDGALEQGRYENGWNAKQILAHVASIEWTYKKLVENAKQPRATARPNADREAAADGAQAPPPANAAEESQAPPPVQAPASNPMDDYNARQVSRRAGMSARELLQEFKENRAGTIAAVESCDEDLLMQETRSAGGAQGTLARVIEFVAVQHVQQHTRDLVGE